MPSQASFLYLGHVTGGKENMGSVSFNAEKVIRGVSEILDMHKTSHLDAELEPQFWEQISPCSG